MVGWWLLDAVLSQTRPDKERPDDSYCAGCRKQLAAVHSNAAA